MEENVNKLADELLRIFSKAEIEELAFEEDLSKYQRDPVGFIEKYFGFKLTDDVKELCESFRDNRVTIAISATGTGKAIVHGEKIVTPEGFVDIKDLKIGNYISNTYGSKSKIIGVYPQGLKESCLIEFNDGSKTKCSLEHIWTVEDRRSHFKKKNLTVNEILKTSVRSLDGSVRWRLPQIDSIYFEEKKYDLDPYVFGVWLGDGCRNFSQISNIDSEVWNYIKKVGFKITKSNRKSPTKSVYGLANKLGKIGILDKYSYQKYIPREYLEGSREQRLDLLRGLLDTDGTIDTRGLTTYYSTSYKLANDVRFLIRSLGGFVKNIGVKKTTHRDCYVVHFSLFCKEHIFKIKRKEERRKKQLNNKFGGRKYITNIKLIGEQECTCIEVDSKDHLFIVGEDFVPTHNSHGAALLAIWAYKCFPGSIVNTFAAPPERNLKEKLWGEIRTNTRINKRLFSKDRITTLKISDDGNNEDSAGKHAILGVTIPTSKTDEEKESVVSGSHAPFQFFVFDEGDAIPDPIYVGVDGCMSGGFERLLVMFNPKKRSGAAYRKIKDGSAKVIKLGAFTHPNVITGKDIIPGAVSRNVTVKRINSWTKPLAPGEEPNPKTCFKVPDFLVGKQAENDNGEMFPPLQAGWRLIQNQAFHYQVLGQYPAQSSNQLISSEYIDAARNRWDLYVAANGENPPEGVRPVNGVDVADEGGDWNSVCSRYGGYVPRIIKWKGVDVEISAHKSVDIHANLHAKRTNVESDGLGSSVAPTMGRQYYYRCHKCEKSYMDSISECPECGLEIERIHVDAKKVKVGSKSGRKCDFGEFGLLRDELWWALREWLRTDNTAMLPPSKDLIEELEIVEYEVDKVVKITSKKMMRKLLGRSPDEADALIQTFYEPLTPKIRVI